MNRVHTIAFRLTHLLRFVCPSSAALYGQRRPIAVTRQPENPFAPEPAPPLPAGMTGSDTNDPRAKLAPGMYDAGETSMGLKHLTLFKKPDAFQLGSDNPDNPKVQKTLGLLGVGDTSKMAKPLQLVIAQLAFANSDLAFQGNHLFQGNFYGMNIYDISDPAKAKLVDFDGLSGRTGRSVGLQKPDVHVGRDAERPTRLRHCRDFRRAPPPAAAEGPRLPPAQKDRFRGVRIFDITDITNPKQVAAVQTCRGSHTHTLVVDPNDKDNVYIYVSGTSFVRQNEELAGCSGEDPGQGSEYGAVSH